MSPSRSHPAGRGTPLAAPHVPAPGRLPRGGRADGSGLVWETRAQRGAPGPGGAGAAAPERED